MLGSCALGSLLPPSQPRICFWLGLRSYVFLIQVAFCKIHTAIIIDSPLSPTPFFFSPLLSPCHPEHCLLQDAHIWLQLCYWDCCCILSGFVSSLAFYLPFSQHKALHCSDIHLTVVCLFLY